jgi:hypothetical protein
MITDMRKCGQDERDIAKRQSKIVKWQEKLREQEAAAAAAAATASDDYAEKLVEAARAVQGGAADNQAEVDALAKELE